MDGLSRTGTEVEDDEEFACMTPEEIRRKQANEVSNVAELLSVSFHEAAALLCHFRWKKEALLARYFENPDKLRKEVGLASLAEEKQVVSKAIELSGEIECSICADEVPASQCTALSCDHRFCNKCWQQYLTLKITEGEVTRIKCPQVKCNLIVQESVIKMLVTAEIYDKYLRYITKSFVEDNDGKRKWCPRPGCGNAITAEIISGTIVKCTCGYRFCFSCHKEAHAPATCIQVKEWEKKCKDDSETTHWKYANTKDCPKCETSTEKHGGCNHMTCRQCKHEWCWVCTRPWRGHNDYYNCNKFLVDLEKEKSSKVPKLTSLFKRSSKKDKIREREAQREKHRLELERYLHYYERYMNHSHSHNLEQQIKEKALTKMKEMQKEATTASEVKYIVDGTEVLLECRNVLKYTYVYAYYLLEASSPEKTLFEYLQRDLEQTTESLSEILESSEQRLKALNTIQLANTRKDNLLKAVEQGLTNYVQE